MTDTPTAHPTVDDAPVHLTVAIVTYNRAQLLDRCLETVYAACQRASHEIIVVDNGSRDATAELVRDKHPAVTLVVNAENVGLTHGVNQAIDLARGDYFLLLDSDTELDPDAVDTLLAFHAAHPEVGVAAPQLVYADGTEQGAAKAFPSPMAALFGRKSVLRRLFPNNRFSRRYLISAYSRSDQPYEADSVSAACMLLKRQAIEQVGGMDEDFFVYWSDVDLCRRIKYAGWLVYVVPSARVVHLESQTVSKQSSQAIIGFHQGVYQYYRKHHARSALNPMRILALVGLSLRAALLLVLNKFKPDPQPSGTPQRRVKNAGMQQSS